MQDYAKDHHLIAKELRMCEEKEELQVSVYISKEM